MRLHRLEVTAFGPFADTAVVDFDELGADGLFLLHGQTGAGKTTVLDAIAFALYGSVPGARGEKRLHSDHADDQTSAQVVLEATIGGRRLRLTRSPEYWRPSKRAKTGLVKQNATVTLEWLDGRGQNLSRITDVGEEVLRLLGMSADQFFQVVLLPQGDFARFLRADNEDRELLLEKLFDTGRFGTAEQWLLDRKRDSSRKLEAAAQEMDRLIERVVEVAGPSGLDTGAEGVPATSSAESGASSPFGSVEWSRSLLARARADLGEAAAELERRQKDSLSAQEAAEAERGLRERHRRRTAAETQLAEWSATAEQRSARQAELDRARRAEPAAVTLAEARAAATSLARRRKEAVHVAEGLAHRLLEPGSAELPGTDWAAVDLASRELAGSDLAADLDDLRAAVEETGLHATERPAGLAHESEDMEAVAGNAVTSVLLPSGEALGSASAVPITGGAPAAGSGGDALFVLDSSGDTGIVPSESDSGSSEYDDRSEPPDDSAPGLEDAVRRWSAQVGALDEIRADAESARTLSGELARLRTEQRDSAARAEALVKRHAELPEAIAGAESRLRVAVDAAARLPVLSAELERLRSAATAALELDRRRDESVHAEAALEQARSAHAAAWQRTQSLREQRMAGMAAELAGALEAGEPCSVCGSTVHPDPAQAAEHAVSKADEDAALAAERAAEAERERAGQRVAELERAVEVLIERGGDSDRAELAAALQDTATRHAAAEREAARVEQYTAELNRLREDATRLAEESRDHESRSSAIAERIAAADRRLAELTERLRVAAGADGTVDRRRARLEALIADATAVGAARSAAAGACEQLAAAAVRLETLCREAALVESAPPVMGEDGPDYTVLGEYGRAVDAAGRPAARQQEIEDELVAADRARAHAQAVLAEPEIQAVAGIVPGDLGQLESVVAQARSALDRAVAGHSEADRRVERLRELCGQLRTAAERVAPLRDAYAELSGLADVVAGRGANNRKMSLRSYVLAARLEEVALAGSVRLRRMSGGRYEFVHSDAAGPRGRRGGLGLDVRDDYTGAIRPANSLSGGETFMASLSLALGLADVVSAEAGGLVLDTLFIDEGFGSLDADTLDAVMGVLDDLRSNGRVVGVVSHVDEMRQRIPSRLHVIRGRNGSRLETTLSV